MQLYAYIPREDNTEPLGTDGRMIIRDLKTLKGAINRINSIPRWKQRGFIIKSFSNFYDDKTFRTLYTQSPSLPNTQR